MRPLSTFRAVLLALAAAAAGWASSSAALVFGADDRQVVSTDPGSPFAPVGIVYGSPEAGYGTAFLVDDCYALTVQHAFGSSRSAVGRRIMFAGGVSGTPDRWRTSRAVVVADGGLEQAPASDAYGMRSRDWALLRLSKCLGREFGFVTLTAAVPDATETVAMAGYPIDKPLSGGLQLDRSCRVRDERSGVLLHDCASLPGNSGSPMFRIVSAGGRQRLEVFAMNTAGHSYNTPGRDLVLPVTQYSAAYSNVAAPIAVCASARPRPGGRGLQLGGCAAEPGGAGSRSMASRDGGEDVTE